MRAGTIRAARAWALALSVAAVMVWTLAPAGIIELGQKGQGKKGSSFTIAINGDPDLTITDPGLFNGEDAELILDRMITDLIAKGALHGKTVTATRIDPNNPTLNAYSVQLDGLEPSGIEVVVDDPNAVPGDGIFGGRSKVAVDAPGNWIFRFDGVDAVSGDGSGGAGTGVATVIVDFDSGPDLTATTGTSGKTAAQVNQDLISQLNGDPRVIVVPASGATASQVTQIIPVGGDRIVSVNSYADDVDTTRFYVQRNAQGGGQPVPVLPAAGLAGLALLLGAAAWMVLRRRKSAPGA